MTEGKFCFLQH